MANENDKQETRLCPLMSSEPGAYTRCKGDQCMLYAPETGPNGVKYGYCAITRIALSTATMARLSRP